MPQSQYYYHASGQQAGPVSFAELQQMAATNQLRPEDQVWLEESESWVEARTVSGLFAAAAGPARRAAVPKPAAADPVRRPAASTSRSPATAGGLETASQLPHIRLIDAALDWFRRVLSADALDSVDRLAKSVGNIAYLAAAGLVVVTILLVAVKAPGNKAGFFLTALAVAPAALLLHYAAVMFLDAGRSLIAKSPSGLGSVGFLRCFALFQGVAVILALVATLTALGTENPLGAGTMILAAFVSVYLIGVALSPQAVNVTVGGDVTAGEEAVGILAMMAKMGLRLVPLIFGVGASVGCAGMIWLIYQVVAKDPYFALTATPIGLSALAVALVPFLFYLQFLLAYLFIDVLRSILVVPGKLDVLAREKE